MFTQDISKRCTYNLKVRKKGRKDHHIFFIIPLFHLGTKKFKQSYNKGSKSWRVFLNKHILNDRFISVDFVIFITALHVFEVAFYFKPCSFDIKGWLTVFKYLNEVQVIYVTAFCVRI